MASVRPHTSLRRKGTWFVEGAADELFQWPLDGHAGIVGRVRLCVKENPPPHRTVELATVQLAPSGESGLRSQIGGYVVRSAGMSSVALSSIEYRRQEGRKRRLPSRSCIEKEVGRTLSPNPAPCHGGV
jgi:hypothetical protein